MPAPCKCSTARHQALPTTTSSSRRTRSAARRTRVASSAAGTGEARRGALAGGTSSVVAGLGVPAGIGQCARGVLGRDIVDERARRELGGTEMREAVDAVATRNDLDVEMAHVEPLAVVGGRLVQG